MGSHTALVRVYHDGTLLDPGGKCDYFGRPDWKYQPNDPAERAKWEERTANPGRVETMLLTGQPTVAEAGAPHSSDE